MSERRIMISKISKVTKAPKTRLEATEGEKKSRENTGPIVKEMEPMRETRMTVNLPITIIALAIIIAGGFTGFVLANAKNSGSSLLTTSGTENTSGVKKVVGLSADRVGKDEAEGVLKAGGIDGEGSHHLEREGGPSQFVYLTSSVVPLDDYLDKKVKVQGQTFAGEKAGWLMDVGRLELLE